MVEEKYNELSKEEVTGQSYSLEVEKFLEEFRKRTIGIYEKERVFYILEKMKNDPEYKLPDSFENKLDKMLEGKDTIDNIYNEVMLPLENYHQELVDSVEKMEEVVDSVIEEQNKNITIDNEESLVELHPKTDELVKDQIVEENNFDPSVSEDIPFIEIMAGLGVSVIAHGNNMASLRFVENQMGAASLVLETLTSIPGVRMLLSYNDGGYDIGIQPTLDSGRTLEDLFVFLGDEIQNKQLNDNTTIDPLANDSTIILSVLESVKKDDKDLTVGLTTLEDGSISYLLRTDDIILNDIFIDMGLPKGVEGNEFTTKDGKQTSTIMKGIELELNKMNQIMPMEIVKIPDTALDIEEKSSIITRYEANIDDITSATITITTPLISPSYTLEEAYENASPERFVDVSLEIGTGEKVSTSTKNIHYTSGEEFDAEVMSQINTSDKTESLGNASITTNIDDGTITLKTDSNEEYSYQINSGQNLENKEIVQQFIKNSGLSNEEVKSIDKEQLNKEKEKVYVKTLPKPSNDKVAGNANVIILYFILFIQIASLVGVFFLLK